MTILVKLKADQSLDISPVDMLVAGGLFSITEQYTLHSFHQSFVHSAVMYFLVYSNESPTYYCACCARRPEIGSGSFSPYDLSHFVRGAGLSHVFVANFTIDQIPDLTSQLSIFNDSHTQR